MCARVREEGGKIARARVRASRDKHRCKKKAVRKALGCLTFS